MKKSGGSGWRIDVSCAYENLEDTAGVRKKQLDEAYGLSTTLVDIGYVLFHKRIEGSIPDCLQEAIDETQASLFLGMHAYYSSSLILLRRIIENSLSGIFFDYHSNEYDRYKSGQRDLPRFKVMLESIFETSSRKVRRIKDYNKKHHLKDDIYDLYRYLCEFVHEVRDETFQWGDIVPRFNDEKFDEWFEVFSRTLNQIIIVELLRHPFLLRSEIKDKYKIDFSEVLNEETMTRIHSIL